MISGWDYYGDFSSAQSIRFLPVKTALEAITEAINERCKLIATPDFKNPYFTQDSAFLAIRRVVDRVSSLSAGYVIPEVMEDSTGKYADNWDFLLQAFDPDNLLSDLYFRHFSAEIVYALVKIIDYLRVVQGQVTDGRYVTNWQSGAYWDPEDAWRAAKNALGSAPLNLVGGTDGGNYVGFGYTIGAVVEGGKNYGYINRSFARYRPINADLVTGFTAGKFISWGRRATSIFNMPGCEYPYYTRIRSIVPDSLSNSIYSESTMRSIGSSTPNQYAPDDVAWTGSFAAGYDFYNPGGLKFRLY